MASRRSLMLSGIALLGGGAEAAASGRGHGGPGRISPPWPVTHVAVILEDGQRTDLDSLTRGRVTALQFVLTGCSSICPVLGTIFSRVQSELSGANGCQLVSLSLDPEHDTPASFAAWLRRFDAGRAWRGAIPLAGQAGVVDLLRAWGLGSGTSSDFHTETVLLIDRSARLVFRFPDLPDPVAVATMMRRLALGGTRASL